MCPKHEPPYFQQGSKSVCNVLHLSPGYIIWQFLIHYFTGDKLWIKSVKMQLEAKDKTRSIVIWVCTYLQKDTGDICSLELRSGQTLRMTRYPILRSRKSSLRLKTTFGEDRNILWHTEFISCQQNPASNSGKLSTSNICQHYTYLLFDKLMTYYQIFANHLIYGIRELGQLARIIMAPTRDAHSRKYSISKTKKFQQL